MNLQRFAQVLGLFQVAVVAGWIAAWHAGFGAGGMQNASAASIEDRGQPSRTAVAELAGALQASVVGKAAVGHVDVATDPRSAMKFVAESTAGSDEPKPLVETAPTASSQPPETPPMQVATASMTDPSPGVASDEPKGEFKDELKGESKVKDEPKDESKLIAEIAATDSPQTKPPAAAPVQLATASTSDLPPDDVLKPLSRFENPDQCPAADVCIDRYLWAIYQRTPKEDSIKVNEQRQVTVKKKGKTVTVTKTFTRIEDEDFGWKDPKAAERMGMSMMDYVVGGMDQSFRLKLYNLLRAAEAAGLSPGITSAFRDDYRQSIASGLKAASDRSYHGGSSRGGYGHGLAADLVSTKGETRDQRYASSEALWKWIDVHGQEFGIGRPYLDRDPPHVAPIDGNEYASHRGTKTQRADARVKKHSPIAVRDDHNAVKHPKTARSSKVRTI